MAFLFFSYINSGVFKYSFFHCKNTFLLFTINGGRGNAFLLHSDTSITRSVTIASSMGFPAMQTCICVQHSLLLLMWGVL